MNIIALVGPSGTGKSHRALVVAHEHNVDTIIDDGLLIKDSKIIAGYSAKKEPSKIRAVKRAIFMDPDHAREVREAITKVKPERMLILGTSVNMVEKILAALELPSINQTIRIEEIATKSEIEKARESRLKEGKHIIPVPTIELKAHFSGYLIDPLEIFFKKPQAAKRRKLGEKSIVRPMFSYYGKLLISDAAIAAIVDYVATREPGITRTMQIAIKNFFEKEKGISISLDVTVKYGYPLWDVVHQAQHQIKNTVEYMTGMLVKEVNIEVKRLSLD
ncbi:alkaline shock protein asp23 [Lucifera butyrica]|uniref:Alkaline shock protein asp23 n=1 Tax=Lucifera butyrica TaxID=1351585 RepID=A0A498R5A2_9FIRM|nr:Asp23/Gls24 family envelope stress response protein [Lucifera butyrica]VBB06000.1 alkaline shock protein asp23 [Lucifera butyrica]